MSTTLVESEPAHAKPAAAAAPAPKAAGGRKAFIILGAVAVVGAASVFAFTALNRDKESTDDAQIDADVVPLAPRVGGMVKELAVHDNQPVKKGDLLVVIDPVDFEVQVKRAEAELDAARAQATSAESGVTIAEASSKGSLSSAKAQLSGSADAVSGADAQIAAAKAGLARAQIDADKAEGDLTRAKSLRTTDSVSQASLEDTQAKRDAAQAALTQAKAQLVAAEDARKMASSRVEEAKGRVEQSTPIDAHISAARAAAELAKARVKSAEAALEMAKLQLSYAKITAPADGVVSKLSVHEGQLVQPGFTLVELVPAATYVVANFKETQVGRMKPGERATIEIDALPGRKFEGKVESLSGGTGARFSLLPPENATGNFVKVVQRVPVRITWLNPPADFSPRAGLSADVTVHLE